MSMRKIAILVVVFFVICAACLLLMRSCGGDRKNAEAAVPTPDAALASPTATPVITPQPTPQPTPNYAGAVWTTDGVNLRQGPGTDYNIIIALEKGTQLERTGLADNGWSIVLYNSEECYVSTDYLTDVAPASSTSGSPTAGFNVTPCNDTVWSTDGINLRRGPGTDYDIAVTVEKGTELRRTGTTENNWSRVIYDNVGYYVSSEYLSTSAPTPDLESGDTAAATPSPSPDAAAANAGIAFETMGEFSSDTGTSLNLIVRWSVATDTAGKKTLTLNAYSSSYALQAAAAPDDLCFKVGNDTFNVTSKGVEVTATTATETLLGTCTVEVTQFNVPITVGWRFNGTYSGKKLDTIEASTSLTLGG